MRILATTHNFKREGAQIILFRLLRRLRSRHEVTVLCADRNEPLREEYERLGIPCVGKARPSAFDVVLANTLLGASYVMQFARRLPVVWWIHEPRFGLKIIDRGAADPAAFAAARVIVFPTDWQAATLYRAYLSKPNWRVVPYGIGLDTAPRPCPFDKRPDRFDLVHVGLVDWRKGQDLTQAAIGLLDDPRLRVFFLGEVMPHMPRVESPSFVWCGAQPEEVVSAYLQHCDAVVFPTRDDLITLAILEALLFSKCVLASDYGPIPRTIRHGHTGLLSPTGDAHMLAANIRMIRDDARLLARLGAAGRKAYDEQHDFERHVAGMEAALAAAAGGADQ
jgi:glycosyltransferase involved in cell wall biosynthesis